MKAVILAAGRGTRMGELTESLPKPMLPVQGKPILQHILEGLKSAGIREVFLVTGWQAEIIENHFKSGDSLGMRLSYGRQRVTNGTGKAPEIAKAFVGQDPFLLTYGDILVRPQTYSDMTRRFREGSFDGVVTVTGSADVTKGGINFFDEEFCLQRLYEKPTAAQIDQFRKEGLLKPGDTAWYNAGIYIFKPVVFDYTARLELSPRGEYELTDAINAMASAGRRLAGLAIEGRWVDVRDPEVLAQLEQSGQAPPLLDISLPEAVNTAMPFVRIFWLGILLVGVSAIGTGCRSTYYSMWEKLGKEKRDLLRDQVEAAKEDQQEASEQFKDALTRLKELYGTGEETHLEKAYNRLSADYERCHSRAAQVRDRIERMESIAADLFAEWEKELESYSSPALKANSQERLQETRAKYRDLRAAMKKAESGMSPVLLQFKDQVLYLKHNLNAQAIGALRGEVQDIEKEITTLIEDMNRSILEADAFIKNL